MKWYTILLTFLYIFNRSSNAATSYRVNNGTNQNITEFSTCKKVTNSSGGDIFVSTNSAAEWSAFYTNPPTGVTIGTCSLFTVSAISGHTSESGTMATYTISLSQAPTANVSMTVTSSNTAYGTVDKSSLTFTTANWNTP